MISIFFLVWRWWLALRFGPQLRSYARLQRGNMKIQRGNMKIENVSSKVVMVIVYLHM